jgi:hypothetical protein
MWIFKFLPDSFFHAFGIIGILAILVSMFLKRIPFVENYYIPIRIVGFVVMCFGIFFEGALYNNREWVARVKEMEAKVAAAEIESKKENIKIVQKVVVKQQIVKERGEDIIKYVDREITKYDNTCVIPKEFVKALNDAAKEVK